MDKILEKAIEVCKWVEWADRDPRVKMAIEDLKKTIETATGKEILVYN